MVGHGVRSLPLLGDPKKKRQCLFNFYSIMSKISILKTVAKHFASREARKVVICLQTCLLTELFSTS